MFVCMCAHIYNCVCAHMYVYIHVCVCLCLFVCMCVCVYVCVYKCVHTCMCMYMFVCLCTCVFVCVCVLGNTVVVAIGITIGSGFRPHFIKKIVCCIFLVLFYSSSVAVTDEDHLIFCVVDCPNLQCYSDIEALEHHLLHTM